MGALPAAKDPTTWHYELVGGKEVCPPPVEAAEDPEGGMAPGAPMEGATVVGATVKDPALGGCWTCITWWLPSGFT